ncbi:MAG: hypothetical protein ABJE95_30430 [Byssovorax sp.]
MRMRNGVGLVAAIALGGGCLQVVSYQDATLDPSCCAGGGGVSTSESSSEVVATSASTSGVGGSCASNVDCPTGVHGTAICDKGVCGYTCEQGFGDCNEMPGCETNTTDNKDHCGSCDVKCSAYCGGTACNDPVYVAAGYSHTCAILKDGSVWCWGENKFGEIGNGTTVGTTAPVKVALPGFAVQISTGGISFMGIFGAHTCATLKDGSVYCWGSNGSGQLGVGSTTSATTPQPLALAGIKQVEAGGMHTCAVDTVGNLSCWGGDIYGQIGTSIKATSLSPVQILTSVVQVVAGANHTCAIMQDATLKCWGMNVKGQLGIGTTTDCTTPCALNVGPDYPKNVVKLSSGSLHTCAVDALGLYCWGSNGSGQLGFGSKTDAHLPQAVSLVGVTAIDLGANYTGAVAGGKLYMWGDNTDGQLGDGTPVSELVPKDVGLENVEQLALGDKHSCAITKAGVLSCWGANANGQIGDGTTMPRPSPVPVVWP